MVIAFTSVDINTWQGVSCLVMSAKLVELCSVKNECRTNTLTSRALYISLCVYIQVDISYIKRNLQQKE